VYLYSRLPDLVVDLSKQCGSAQPRSVSLSRFMHDPANGLLRIPLPRTPVNKGVWR
jgi:hypothetical protein